MYRKKGFILFLAVVFILLAFFVMLHQIIFYGKAFEIKDIHHETFIVALFCIALTLTFAYIFVGGFGNEKGFAGY